MNGTDNIHYTYDNSGNLVSMNLSGTEYYYIRNAQSDIIGLIDGNGNQVASYTYDTWGKLISIKDENGNDVTNTTTHVGYKNPYRYRGYRYDTETGLYYLQSRYYNPEWGGFLNTDAQVGSSGDLLSNNMFAYCKNQPINFSDPSGFVRLCIIEGGSGVSSIAPKNNGMIGTNISVEGCGIFVGFRGTLEFVITEDEMAVAIYGGLGPYNGVPGLNITEGTTQYSISNIDKLEDICWDAGGSYSGVLLTGGQNVIFASGLMGSGQSFGISAGIPGPANHVIPVKTIKLWRTKTPDYSLIIDPT